MKKHIDSISKNPDATPKPEVPTVETITPEKPIEKVVETPTPATPETVPAATAETPVVAEDATPPKVGDPDSFETLFPEPGLAIAGPPSWIWWLLLILASAVLGVVAFGLAQGKFNNWFHLSTGSTATPVVKSSSTPVSTASATAGATATPAATATPTATAATSKANLTLRVLNGTTVAGAAGTAKSALEKAGFTVRTIGNAQNQTYETTTVYYSTGHKEDADSVSTALTGYTTTLTESDALASPDMVLVVVGKK
jgi:outer membrane biosynthesis protein TonB